MKAFLAFAKAQVEKIPTRESLIQRADADLVAHAQYRHAFDTFVVARVKKNIRTKLGLAFTRGEVVLVDPQAMPCELGPLKGVLFMTAYSWSNKCKTSLRASDIDIIGGA